MGVCLVGREGGRRKVLSLCCILFVLGHASWRHETCVEWQWKLWQDEQTRWRNVTDTSGSRAGEFRSFVWDEGVGDAGQCDSSDLFPRRYDESVV